MCVCISVGTIIDYNRRLLGCVFHNDLSIMKLVIDNNRKIRHLAAKHETKRLASCQLSRYETINSKTHEKEVKVLQNVEKVLVL